MMYGARGVGGKGARAHDVGSTKNMPVPLRSFENYMKNWKRKKSWLLANIPSAKTEEEGYITIEGVQNVYNKMTNLSVAGKKERV